MKRDRTPPLYHQINKRHLLILGLIFALVLLLTLLSTTRKHTTTLLSSRQHPNMTSHYQLPPASDFSPDNVQWFHAVNSEAKLASAISTIKKEHQKFHSQQSTAASNGDRTAVDSSSTPTTKREPWFGIEVDIRTTSNTLILSHDPPVVGYVSNLLGRAFGLHTMLQMVQTNLLDVGSGASSSTSTSSPLPPPALIIIKLDVKDQDSLNALSRDIVASLIGSSSEGGSSGTPPPSKKADEQLIPPQLFIHHQYEQKDGVVPRTQVWLNYDVIPYSLQPTNQHPPFNPTLVAPFKEVASALQVFQSRSREEGAVAHQRAHSSVGFSLGWISTAEGGRYKPNGVEAGRGLPIYQPHHYTAMLEFLKMVFPSKTTKTTSIDTKTEEQIIQNTQYKMDLFIITFALRFSLVDYSTLQLFFQDLELYWKSSGWDQEGSLMLFPTMWRGRTETISDSTRKLLEDDARHHKTIACVDQE